LVTSANSTVRQRLAEIDQASFSREQQTPERSLHCRRPKSRLVADH